MRMSSISSDIKDVINYVMEYARETSNWLSVKKEIMWLLPTSKRKLFSRRHYSTKKHSLNEFELQILRYWAKQTGVTLTIPPELQHDSSWVRHRRGWGLKKYNLLRQKAAAKRKNSDEKRRPKKTS